MSSSNGPFVAVDTDDYIILHDTPGTSMADVVTNGQVHLSTAMPIKLPLANTGSLVLTDAPDSRVLAGEVRIHLSDTTGRSPDAPNEQVVTEFHEYVGWRMVQVDMSYKSSLEIIAPPGRRAGQYFPSPMLQDSAGNSYWPSGFYLEQMYVDNPQIEIVLQPEEPISNHIELPELMRKSPQHLTLMFYVKTGVTIESLSYGGGEPKYLFELAVPAGQ